MGVAGVGTRSTVPLGGVRASAGVMLAIAAVRPLVPGSPGIPCPLRTLTGIPCPLCGMTTSVTDTVHLRFAEAVAATPAGIAAVVLAIGLLVLWRVDSISLPAWAIPALLALMWMYQLFRFSIL